jgi:hypothetical protein
LSTYFVGKLFTLMIARLVFNVLEVATFVINVYNPFASSPVGEVMNQVSMTAFDILDYTASAIITTLVCTKSLFLGNPTRTN